MSRSNSEKNEDVLDRWFIQIKGQIVGPMPGQKVLARVISDELTVMSRVSSDRKNWKAICNVSFFEDLVNSRIRAYAGKTEVVGQMGQGIEDETPFETNELNFNEVHTGAIQGISEQLVHARQLEELTANIQKLNAIKKEILLKRKTVAVERDRDDSEEHPDDQNVFISKPVKRFSVKEMFSGNVRHRKMAIASAVLLVGGLIGTISYSAYRDRQEQIALETKAKAEAEARSRGEYQKAAASGDNQIKNATAEELLALAETQLKGKNHAASKLAVKQALAMTLDSSNRARAHAISAAISAAISVAAGDLDLAAEQYTESLQHVELYGTLHGVGILNIRRGNYEEAERFFLKALQLPNPSPADRVITLVQLFETALALDKKVAAENAATTAPGAAPKAAVPNMATTMATTMARTTASLNLVAEAIATTTVGRDRLLLTKAMGDFYLGNKEGFQTSAIELIDEPLDPNAENLKSELDDDLAQWQNLVRHCAIAYNQPPINGLTAAFYAACLSRSHGPAQALPFAKYAFTVNNKDPLFGALYSSVLLSTGDAESAEKILIDNPSFANSSKVARFVLSEIANKRVPATTTGKTEPTSTPQPSGAAPSP
jgi:tetratricopeptide (TPR) repeat protein